MTRSLRALSLAAATLAAAALAACTEPPSSDTDGDLPPQDAPIVVEDLGDGSYETVIDATDHEEWVYFDFEAQRAVTPKNPANDSTWDLAALRFNVKSNGGTSGRGGAQVAILEPASFDTVTAAPADGWIEDNANAPGMGGEMANVDPGYAFDNWFSYDLATHILTPAPDRVYVVRTPEGNHYKLEMLGFYDDAGTPGFVSFRWAALPAG